jgi:hypothetical protein
MTIVDRHRFEVTAGLKSADASGNASALFESLFVKELAESVTVWTSKA